MTIKGVNYFRQVVASVLQWYLELEDGMLPGERFAAGLLDFRIDVGRALKELLPSDVDILLAVHRDGAVYQGIEAIELHAGQLFEGRGLFDIKGYLD